MLVTSAGAESGDFGSRDETDQVGLERRLSMFTCWLLVVELLVVLVDVR